MIRFKNEKDMKLFFLLHPLLQLIATDAAFWSYERNLDFVLTSTVSTLDDDILLKRKSSSHRDKRAIDARVFDWPEKRISELTKFLTNKYGESGAMSISGVKRLVVRHNSGHGDHLHIQLHKRFSL